MPEWPANKIIKRKVSELSASANNSRTHSEAQVSKLAAAIEEWGWTVPVVIDEDGIIIAGHGRLMAAESLGLSEVPCVVAKGWSDAKKRAYLITDNKIAELSSWDDESLRAEILKLQEMDFDIDLLGFDAPEISTILFATDSSGDFLSDMAAKLDGGELPEGAGAGYGDKGAAEDKPKSGVNLTFMMPAENRDVVVKWLVAFRDKHGLDTQAQALAEMAKKEFSL